MEKFNKIFVTFFYVGLLKPAPGTWGSLAGAIIGGLVLKFLMSETLFLLSILLFLISINVINSYEAKNNKHDSSEIVIDEVAGVWFAMSIGGVLWINMILAFLFFRLFDIWKPSIIGMADKRIKGGFGVMCDDMLAGGFAGILVLIVQGIVIKLGFGDFWF